MTPLKKILIGSAIVTILLMSTSNSFGAIKKNQKARLCDGFGCGSFGASRSGGTRKHNGLDIIFAPGESVLSPIDGKVSRHPIPYANDPSYKGIEIKNSRYLVKLFYIENQSPIGTVVKKGQKIATAQDIAAKYGSTMTNHVHIEVYEYGKLINPETLYGL